MRVVAKITRNSDGETRVHSEEYPDDFRISTICYMWTDGNYGCDCNRYLFFERAAGREPDFGEDACGETAYSVVLTLPGGEEFDCQEDR